MKDIQYIKRSIEAHVQNYQSRHFEKTPDGHVLAGFKERHRGEKCFVIGNGPSLRAEDLQVLHDNHVPCFASNRIYDVFDKTDWRPTYYVSEDVDVLRPIQDKASAVQAEAKLIPVNLKWYEGIDVAGATYFYMDYKSEFQDSFGLSLDIPHCLRCRSTVTVTCIQFAVYMGFAEIYLLGVDHSFSKIIDQDGNVIVDSSIQNHFSNYYDPGIVEKGVQIDETTRSYMSAEQLSRKMNTFRIYNATRGGKLEVFERRPFDELFCN